MKLSISRGIRLVPWTVWTYIVLSIIPSLIVLALAPSEILNTVFFLLILALDYGLIRGSRVAWWISVILNLGGILDLLFFFRPIDALQLLMGALIVGGLAFLLARPTRRHIFG